MEIHDRAFTSLTRSTFRVIFRSVISLATVALVFFSLPVPPASAEEVIPAGLDTVELWGARGDWEQVIIHLNEVPPGERGARWQGLVEQASLEYLRQLAKRDDSEVESAAKHLVLEFPSLLRFPAFLEKRNEMMLGGFKRCYQTPANRSICTQRLTEFTADQVGDVALSVSAGELAEAKDGAEAAASLYRAVLRKAPVARVLCEQPAVKRVLKKCPSSLASPDRSVLR